MKKKVLEQLGWGGEEEEEENFFSLHLSCFWNLCVWTYRFQWCQEDDGTSSRHTPRSRELLRFGALPLPLSSRHGSTTRSSCTEVRDMLSCVCCGFCFNGSCFCLNQVLQNFKPGDFVDAHWCGLKTVKSCLQGCRLLLFCRWYDRAEEEGEEEEACEMGEGRVAAIGTNIHQNWATILHPCWHSCSGVCRWIGRAAGQ